MRLIHIILALGLSACGDIVTADSNGTPDPDPGSTPTDPDVCNVPCPAAGTCEEVTCDSSKPAEERCIYSPLPERAACSIPSGDGFCESQECVPCSTEDGCSSTASWPIVDNTLDSLMWWLTNWTDVWTCSGPVCGTSFVNRAAGDHGNFFLTPTQVMAIEIPPGPGGMFQTSKIVYSTSGARIFVSKVPGRMDPTDPTMVGRGDCSSYTTNYDMTLRWNGDDVAPGAPLVPGACHIPSNQGPWFANIQLDYTVAFDEYGPGGCTQLTYGQPCAVNILWYIR